MNGCCDRHNEAWKRRNRGGGAPSASPRAGTFDAARALLGSCLGAALARVPLECPLERRSGVARAPLVRVGLGGFDLPRRLHHGDPGEASPIKERMKKKKPTSDASMPCLYTNLGAAAARKRIGTPKDLRLTTPAETLRRPRNSWAPTHENAPHRKTTALGGRVC